MQKRFYINFALLLLLNFLIKPLWIFGIDLKVQNVVGASLYGAYFAVFNFTYLFHLLLDLGINNYNNRTIASQPALIHSYLPNMVFVKVLLAVIYTALVVSIAVLIRFDSWQRSILWWMVLNQVLLSFLLYIRSNLAALHYFKTDSVFSVLDKALMILICGFLLYHPVWQEKFNIEWFIYAQTFALASTVTISGAVLLRISGRFELHLKTGLIKKILRETFPFALIGILMSIYYRIDGVMIERMLSDGKEQAGIYAASFRLLDALSMVGYLMASLLLPMYARMLAEKTDISGLFKTTSFLMIAITLPVAICCFLYPVEVIQGLYPQSDPYWAEIFRFLMLSLIFIGQMYVMGSLLTANNNVWQLNAIAGIGVIVNIVLNYFMIPSWKAFGAAMATLITQAIVVFAHFIAVSMQFKIKVSYAIVMRIAAYTLINIVVGISFNQLTIPWYAGATAILVVSIPAGILTGLIDLRSFAELLKSQKFKS